MSPEPMSPELIVEAYQLPSPVKLCNYSASALEHLCSVVSTAGTLHALVCSVQVLVLAPYALPPVRCSFRHPG
jgi:hypothetical protein